MIDDLFETLAEVVRVQEPKTKRVCAECGSDKVERMVWADVNTGEFHGDAGDGAVYCLACDRNVKLFTPKPTRYHIVEVGCSHAALPAEWLEECDLVRSDLTREEAVEWEGLHPDRIGSGATVLDHKTPDELRGYMKAGDIGSLHVVVSLINDAHDEGYLKDGVAALLLGGDA